MGTIFHFLNALIKRYVRVGEVVFLYSGDGSLRRISLVTKIEGCGPWACVRMDYRPYGGIRRDCIRKDETGNWFYRYG